MREYCDWETKYEFEPTTEPETVGEYPESIPEDIDGWDSLKDVPFAGDNGRNGVEGTESADYSDEIIDVSDDVAEDTTTSDSSTENTNYTDEIPEDINDMSADAQDLNGVSEWISDINPNYDAFDPYSDYSNNCGSCAYAVYQRLEGISNDSVASSENIPYNEDMEALTGMEQVPMDPSEIEQRLLDEGDGAHAIIGIDRAEGAGHWFNAACIDGKVVAIDGQTGEITDWPPDYGDVVNWEMSVKKGE